MSAVRWNAGRGERWEPATLDGGGDDASHDLEGKSMVDFTVIVITVIIYSAHWEELRRGWAIG